VRTRRGSNASKNLVPAAALEKRAVILKNLSRSTGPLYLTQLCNISNAKIYLYILQTSNTIASRFEFQPGFKCILRHMTPCSLVDRNEIMVKPVMSDIQTEYVATLTKETTFAPETLVCIYPSLQFATIHKPIIFTHTTVKTAFLTHPESVSPVLFQGSVCKQYRIDFFQTLTYLPHHSSHMFVKNYLLVERFHIYVSFGPTVTNN